MNAKEELREYIQLFRLDHGRTPSQHEIDAKKRRLKLLPPKPKKKKPRKKPIQYPKKTTPPRTWITTSKKSFKNKKSKGRAYARMLISKATPHELMVKDALKKAGVIFRFQHATTTKEVMYISDFYFVLTDGSKLIVELDGKHHLYGQQKANDAKRDEWFLKRGVITLRFQNRYIEKSLDAVIVEILSHNPKIKTKPAKKHID
jgi:very-short-patch-repair endonuclease